VDALNYLVQQYALYIWDWLVAGIDHSSKDLRDFERCGSAVSVLIQVCHFDITDLRFRITLSFLLAVN
jgi:hypothetical protein